MPANSNPWIDHVKAVYGRSNSKLTYKEAMVRASATWKKKKPTKPAYRGNWLGVRYDRLTVTPILNLVADVMEGQTYDYRLSDIDSIEITNTDIILHMIVREDGDEKTVVRPIKNRQKVYDAVRAFLIQKHLKSYLSLLK